MIRPLLLCLILAACGGGAGSASPPQPPAPQRSDLLFGYFGSVENPADFFQPGTGCSSVCEIGNSANVVMTGGWGDRSTSAGRQAIAATAIKHMQEAEAFGIHRLIVSVDFLLFDDSAQYRGQAAITEVDAFLGSLSQLGLLQDVVALYPLDEPNVNKMKGVDQALLDLRKLLTSQTDTSHIQLFAIYGPTRLGLPQVGSFDWVGLDDYDLAVGVLGEIDASLRPALRSDQKIVVVPGGASPWKQEPKPFLDYANANSDVVMLMPFVWFNVAPTVGIRSNGMAPVYRSTGCLIQGREC